MKKQLTRYDKINREISMAQAKKYLLEKEKELATEELQEYCRKHKSMRFDALKTEDTQKLLAIYDFMDKNYPVDWEGGIRCDNRGMKLHFWLDDDPDFLIIHLSSTSKNICFSRSTSWIVEAPTLTKKIEVLKYIKENVLKILKK